MSRDVEHKSQRPRALSDGGVVACHGHRREHEAGEKKFPLRTRHDSDGVSCFACGTSYALV